MKCSWLPALLALSLAGCSTADVTPVAPTAQAAGPALPAAGPTVTAVGQLHPLGSNGALLALVAPYTIADIDHVVLTLTLGGAAAGTQTLTASQLKLPVSFANLQYQQTYTIVAKAYKADGTQIDNGTLDATTCTTAFTTTTYPTSAIGPIALRLVSPVFSGTTAPAPVSVTDGRLIDTGASTAIAVSTTTTASVSTLAGVALASGTADSTDTPPSGATARFYQPFGLAYDGANTLYVADTGNNRIRKVDTTSGATTTMAISGVNLNTPDSLTLDGAGTMYIADSNNNQIVRVVLATGAASVLVPASVGLKTPTSVALDGRGNLFIADYNNNRIVKVALANPTAITPIGAGFNHPIGIVSDGAGSLYVADQANNEIQKLNLADSSQVVVAGSTLAGHQDGVGTQALLNWPTGVALDGRGNLYVAEQNGNVIRRIWLASGMVTTIAGTPAAGHADGSGSAAGFYQPTGIACDSAGGLYVVDWFNFTIRKLH